MEALALSWTPGRPCGSTASARAAKSRSSGREVSASGRGSTGGFAGGDDLDVAGHVGADGQEQAEFVAQAGLRRRP